MADGGVGEAALANTVLAGASGVGTATALGPTAADVLGMDAGMGGVGAATSGMFSGALSPEIASMLGASGAVAPATAGTALGSAAGSSLASDIAAQGAAMAPVAPTAAGASAGTSGLTLPSLTSGLPSQGLQIPADAGSYLGQGTAAANAGQGIPSNLAQSAFNQVSNSAINNASSSPSGIQGIINSMRNNPMTTAALGLGGYTLYNLLTGKGNNYLAPYTPVSAGSMGLGGTLAAGYRPTRPMAAGGATTPTTSSTTAAAPVSDTVPYTPTSWGGVVPSTGVMPSDLKASTTSGSPLTMAQLQNMAAQYGYSLPNTSGVSGTTTLAGGGIASLPNNVSYPQGQIQSASYTTPTQMPTSAQQVRQYGMSPVMMANGGQAQYDPYSEIQQQYMMSRLSGMPQVVPTASAKGGKINGNLGSYSDGGQMLQGPGDGMSDSIPADIAGKQPARLADGEFVVPADVVSGLGNGSTDAGAKHLYGMMDRVRKARTGTTKQGKQINPTKHLPA